jgi:hypothetical protein
MFALVCLWRCGLISWCAANSKDLGVTRPDAIRAGSHHIWFTMPDFDYDAPAEVFACRSRGSSPRPVTYRRFTSGAEAVRFAVEELPADLLFGTVIEANEQRFEAAQIRKLYESTAYPLQRRDTA